MYQHKEYRTLRTFARISAGFGWVVVAILFLIGLIGGMQTDGLLTGLIAGLLLGFVFGIGFIVYGQLVSVFLDQKEVLEELLEIQRRAGSP